VTGDTVVATLNGRKFTADQVRALVAGSPQQVQAYFQKNPKQFLREHAFYLVLMDYAEKNGLDKKSPFREAIEFQRMFILTNAAMNYKMTTIDVSPEEQKKFYEANQSQFREARVRMIYIPFADALAEEQAKTKAAGLTKRARAGEDFVKLAKENSDDQTEAGADFTVRADSSQPPEQMRKVLLNLKAGDISDPLRHDNGYYIFRVESANVLPYEQVRDEIYKRIQTARFSDWQQQARSQTSVQFDNEAFFQSVGPKQ
jgi:parvulin-like peptidyl-prolyl isomerase